MLSASNARKSRLLHMQEQFRQIEELYLTFAKKASAFNSWFENAEEDLTDPVRCNSIEEIRYAVLIQRFFVKIIVAMLSGCASFNEFVFVASKKFTYNLIYKKKLII